MPITRNLAEELAVALDAIVVDKHVRRYLALNHPDALLQAQRAIAAFHRDHSGEATAGAAAAG